MRTVIIPIATLVLMANVWFVNLELKTFNQQNEKLRWVSSEAAVAGALYTDEESESAGIVAFKDAESLTAVDAVISKNLHLSAQRDPETGAYWQQRASVTVYLLDDVSCRVYRDGKKLKEFTFRYPYEFTVDGTPFTYVAGHPTVAVAIDAGDKRIGGGLIQTMAHATRTSAYEKQEKRN